MEKFSTVVLLPLFLGTCIYMAVGVGTSVIRVLKLDQKSDHLLSFLFGTAAICYLTAAIGHLGFLTFPVVISVSIILFACSRKFFPMLPFCKTIWGNLSETFHKNPVLFSVLVGFIFFRYCEAFLPNGQGDAIYYHVAGPRLWAKAGRVEFIPWSPWQYQSGLFEYFYTYFAVFLKNPFQLLIMCQMFHALFGLIVAPYYLFRIGQKVFQRNDLALISCLAFVTIPNDPLALIRAKNDGFVLGFTIAVIFYLLNYFENRNAKDLRTIYFLSGILLAIKHTSLFFLIPLAAVLAIDVCRKPKTLKNHFLNALLVLPFSLVTLLRNYLATNDPFFPAMTNIFPSPYMNDIILAYVDSYMRLSISFSHSLITQWWSYPGTKPIYALATMSLINYKSKDIRTLFALAAFGLALLIYLTGAGTASFRFTFYLYGLCAVLGVNCLYFLWGLQERLNFKVLVIAATVLSLVNSGYDVAVYRFFVRLPKFYFSSQSYFDYMAQDKSLMHVFSWINKNYQEGMIFSASTSESLFLDIPISQVNQEVEVTNILYSNTTAEGFASAFKKSKYTLFLRDVDSLECERRHPYLRDLEKYFTPIFQHETYIVYKLKSL